MELSCPWKCNIARTLGVSALVFNTLFAVPELLAQTAPTITQAPAVIDQAWRDASAKYDGARAALLKEVDRQASAGPFRPDWESLSHYQTPDWFQDAKFGIFIHWGVYSVPAFGNEWYPRNMYMKDSKEYQHHIATYGPQSKFGYKDFIPMFKAEHFDAKEWAQLFKDSGAKYVVPVFEHHDGFAMYDSGLSDWTVAKMGPHRDTGGELAKAIREAGMHFGASSHRIEHDFFMCEGRKIESDVNDPKNAALYGPAQLWIPGRPSLIDEWTSVSTAYEDDWLARDAEIVEKYHPDLMWFDWWIGEPDVRRHLARFAAYYYNESSKNGTIGVINYKLSAMHPDSAVLDIERGQLTDIRPQYWQTDTSISNKSWGYIENDSFKSPETIVHQLADIVSKNGNLLVNIGPRSDGTIPDEARRTLLDIGSWLKVNGEAIYGTRPWRTFGEGPTKVVEGAFHDTDSKPYTPQDFRFTTKGDAVYAIELGWPSAAAVLIDSFPLGVGNQKISSVSLLGSASKLQYEQKADGLHIKLPAQAPGKYAYVFKIAF
ncbi:MAG: alpha-L-fucosidase [Candidatus Acidiferrum sp.]